MKLWILRPREDLPEGKNPWEPWYDKCFGMVIRAETEEEARRIADVEGGAPELQWEDQHPWLDPEFSTCEELLPGEEPGLVIRDFHDA